MSRYNDTKKVKNFIGGKVYYETTYYNDVPLKNDDLYFISTEGDRCDNLAYRFYGTPELWWFIARVNNLNAMNIPAGIQLRIPPTISDAKGS